MEVQCDLSQFLSSGQHSSLKAGAVVVGSVGTTEMCGFAAECSLCSRQDSLELGEAIMANKSG